VLAAELHSRSAELSKSMPETQGHMLLRAGTAWLNAAADEAKSQQQTQDGQGLGEGSNLSASEHVQVCFRGSAEMVGIGKVVQNTGCGLNCVQSQ